MKHKFNLLGGLALKKDDLSTMLDTLMDMDNLSNDEMQHIYECDI